MAVGGLMEGKTYLERAADADALAENCEDGSVQQREFRYIAARWRALAALMGPNSPPKLEEFLARLRR